MKNLIFVLLSVISFATAQNRLYVRVVQSEMALLGYGGSTYLYDHILLLPDGTAVRFDGDVVLPTNIVLATATANELVSVGGTQGTYQDQGASVQTNFGVSFASAGEKFSFDSDKNGYMLISALPATLITGQFESSSTTIMGSSEGGFATQVMASSSSAYDFYPDGSFDNAESSGVSSTSNNAAGDPSVGVTSSGEGGSAGTYVFEGYNLFLTMSDDSQSIFPAYLWPADLPLEDQILTIVGSEYLPRDSTIPLTQVPATASAPANGSAPNPLTQNTEQNPLAQPGQQPEVAEPNPLATPQAETPQTQNPLAQPQTNESPTTEAVPNPLQAPQPETATTASGNTLSGTVTAPAGVTLSSAYVIVCPTDLVDASDCLTTQVEATGAYRLELPGPGEYMVIVAMDTDGNNELNAGDYKTQDSFDTNGDEAKTMDLVLEPYTE